MHRANAAMRLGCLVGYAGKSERWRGHKLVADVKNIVLVHHIYRPLSKLRLYDGGSPIIDFVTTLSATPWRFPPGSFAHPNDVTFRGRSGVAHGGPCLRPAHV